MVTLNEILIHLSNVVSKKTNVSERVAALGQVKKELEILIAIGNDTSELRCIEELLKFAYETGKLEQFRNDRG